jgi:hypothetical protein
MHTFVSKPSHHRVSCVSERICDGLSHHGFDLSGPTIVYIDVRRILQGGRAGTGLQAPVHAFLSLAIVSVPGNRKDWIAMQRALDARVCCSQH